MTKKLVVYTDMDIGPRLKYVLSFVFGDVLDLDFDILPINEFQDKTTDPCILYVRTPLRVDAIQIHNSDTINFRMDEIRLNGILPYMEIIRNGAKAFDFSADIFSEIFFHLNRAEEYEINAKKDVHGRHLGENSYLYKVGELTSAPVDDYIYELKKMISNRYFKVDYSGEFLFLPTYDVDIAWRFKNKGLFQQLRGIAGDFYRGDLGIFWDRMNTILLSKPDPYDLWDELISWHDNGSKKAVFFLLLSQYSKYDPKVPIKRSQFIDLVRRLRDTGELGIHPSYRSNDGEEILKLEVERYRNLVGINPQRSRQHFLKLHLPQTYQVLCTMKIKEDYSMAYADQIGFRAGTCHPFYWYDLENEKKSSLKIFPTAFMDVTLKKYLGLETEEAFEKMINIEAVVRKYSGTLVSLWHNSSFYDREGWKGWKAMYEKFLSRF